jgi:hypothetical protein
MLDKIYEGLTVLIKNNFVGDFIISQLAYEFNFKVPKSKTFSIF